MKKKKRKRRQNEIGFLLDISGLPFLFFFYVKAYPLTLNRLNIL